MNQPEDQHFHVHNGHRLPTVVLYVKDHDFLDDEEQQFHQHLGQDVLVHTLYVDHGNVTGLIERVGEWCPVCGFEPTATFAACQLDAEVAQFHAQDHGD